jgi:hypothetical protein
VIEPAPPYRGEGPHALWLRQRVIASTLDFSGIRLRNASMAR